MVEPTGSVARPRAFTPGLSTATLRFRFVPPRESGTPAGAVPYSVAVGARRQPGNFDVAAGELEVAPFTELNASLAALSGLVVAAATETGAPTATAIKARQHKASANRPRLRTGRRCECMTAA